MAKLRTELKSQSGKKFFAKSIAIGLATIFIALLVIFLVYPDGLIAIGNAFKDFQTWFLSLLGL